MLFSKRILAVLDGGSHCIDAFNRAQMIATRTGCKIELLWFGEASASAEIQSAIRSSENTGLVCRQIHSKKMLDTVNQLWQEDHFTLLIKGCDQQHNSESLLTPTDWKLLRKTPCPILMVKRRQPWVGGRILAAINPLSSKEHQHHHDQSVLKLAAFIAREERASLQTVVATRSPMQMADPEQQSQELINKQARVATDKLLARIKVPTQQVHIGQGPANYWIARVAAEQDAALVVISSRGRCGITGTLLGNTAEQLLDRLNTDVLVIRPGLADQMPMYH